MIILTPKNFTDYELIDSGDGQKLERFGKFTLDRPDPQIIWKKSLPLSIWQAADAKFTKTSEDKGKWEFNKTLPEKWLCSYDNLKFYIKLSPFKHTGVFPEQSVHWDWIQNSITSSLLQSKSFESKNQPTVLNLFGYTGISSLAASSAGASVVHIDASYPTIGWARENQTASGLENKPVRWILDDAIKFCEREVRRGAKYDGIIMDPPSFGHGPKGETWKFNESFPELMEVVSKLLSKNPLFIIVNAYAISTSAITLENVLQDFLKDFGGTFESGELALKETSSNRLLSTGIFTRWHTD